MSQKRQTLSMDTVYFFSTNLTIMKEKCFIAWCLSTLDAQSGELVAFAIMHKLLMLKQCYNDLVL